MKTLLIYIPIFIALLIDTATAQTYSKSYYRKDGTYSRPYYRTASDSDTERKNYAENISLNTKAGGRSSSSYSDNYHKVYNGDHSNQRYQNYNSLLRYNSFNNITMGSSSTIKNNRGVTIGYLKYSEDGLFKILDSDSVHIGYVKLSNDRKRVRVYDSFGYHVITKSIER